MERRRRAGRARDGAVEATAFWGEARESAPGKCRTISRLRKSSSASIYRLHPTGRRPGLEGRAGGGRASPSAMGGGSRVLVGTTQVRQVPGAAPTGGDGEHSDGADDCGPSASRRSHAHQRTLGRAQGKGCKEDQLVVVVARMQPKKEEQGQRCTGRPCQRPHMQRLTPTTCAHDKPEQGQGHREGREHLEGQAVHDLGPTLGVGAFLPARIVPVPLVAGMAPAGPAYVGVLCVGAGEEPDAHRYCAPRAPTPRREPPNPCTLSDHAPSATRDSCRFACWPQISTLRCGTRLASQTTTAAIHTQDGRGSTRRALARGAVPMGSGPAGVAPRLAKGCARQRSETRRGSFAIPEPWSHSKSTPRAARRPPALRESRHGTGAWDGPSALA